MNHDSSPSDFFFNDELEDFFPYADEDVDDSMSAKPTVDIVFDRPDPTLPAAERIANLMSSMNAAARTLRSVIEFCSTPTPVAQVNDHIAAVQETDFSIYSPATLCNLLERAGAIERVDENGSLITEDAQPEIVEVDGVEYLEPAKEIESFWRATPEGTASLEGPSVGDKLSELLEASGQYEPIYQKVISLCSAEGGASVKALSDAVDDDPVVQDPRRYASFFVDKLEACGALEWRDGAWHFAEAAARAPQA